MSGWWRRCGPGRAIIRRCTQALLDGGYGTLSPLNWRTPLFLSFLSLFPTLESAQVFLGAGDGGRLGARRCLRLSAERRRRAVWAGVVLALSLVAIAAHRAELSFELCAGTLILISVSAYGLGLAMGRVCGGAAGAVRARAGGDLCGRVPSDGAARAAMARGRSRGSSGSRPMRGFYLWHWSQLSALIGPADHAAAADWLQFGGLVFVLRTAAFNGVLLVAPYWVAAIVLVLGLVGLKDLPRAAVTVALYLLLFLVYGRPENEYWGALYAPLVALGLVWAPGALLALVRRAAGTVRQPPPVLPLSGAGT